MAAPPPVPVSLTDLLQQVTAPGANPASVAQTLRTFAPADIREIVLSNLLPGPQDPLAHLDIQTHTLPILFILSARLTESATGAGGGAPPVDLAYVNQFCAEFNVVQARAAPERVTHLAKAIVLSTEAARTPTAAIHPLHTLLGRYASNLSYLTPIHPIFVTACLKNSHAPPVLLEPILGTPISEISTSLFPDLHYTDNLVYHYVGGIIFGQWKDWPRAEEFFEICVGSPVAQTPSAVQWEALKKLVLVQCIFRGKPMPLPKYMHSSLARGLKNSPYSAFTKCYPRSVPQLQRLAEQEKEVFLTDKNTGLIRQALDAAPRWNLKRLTDTYLTLGLAEIGKEIDVTDEDAVRELVVSMIGAGDIAATISADGIVSFFDASVNVSRAQIDAALRETQAQAARLVVLEREITASKEFLTKATKTKEEDKWTGGGEDEEALFGMVRAGTGGIGWEETMSV